MNELDRKVAQILVEARERKFPGTKWVARPATPQDREVRLDAPAFVSRDFDYEQEDDR